MLRTAHRLFSSPLRSSARANLNVAARSHRAALARRTMSSESHASHGSTPNDRPWIIGSALVFGPLFLYLVSPSAHKETHGHHQNHRDVHEDKHAQRDESHRNEDVKPIADDEGTEVSGQEVKESMERAFEADSPKDAQEREEVVEAEVSTAADNSAAEAQSEPSATPALPADTDGATDATNDEKVQSIVSKTSELAAESKA